jgi:hypothetical protein
MLDTRTRELGDELMQPGISKERTHLRVALFVALIWGGSALLKAFGWLDWLDRPPASSELILILTLTLLMAGAAGFYFVVVPLLEVLSADLRGLEGRLTGMLEEKFEDVREGILYQKSTEKLLQDLGGELKGHLEKTEQLLSDLRCTTSKIEWNTLSPFERDQTEVAAAFSRASSPTVRDIREWASGQIFDMLTCSYYYPSTEALLDRIKYRHEAIHDQEVQGRYAVHGFQEMGLGKWLPCKFWCNAKGSETNDLAGDVRVSGLGK